MGKPSPRRADEGELARAQALYAEMYGDFTVKHFHEKSGASWRGRRLQIPASRLRPHFVNATVRLHEHPDGAVALFWGPHRVADFPPLAADPRDLAA